MKNSTQKTMPIDRLVGVKPGDSVVDKMRKGLDLMELAGFAGTREYRDCVRMYNEAVARAAARAA